MNRYLSRRLFKACPKVERLEPRNLLSANLFIDNANPLVQISAFRDDASGNDVFVLINNSPQDETVTLSLANATFAGALSGEQSTAAAVWSPLNGLMPDDDTRVTIVLPAQSVTSLAAPLGSALGTPSRAVATAFARSLTGVVSIDLSASL